MTSSGSSDVGGSHAANSHMEFISKLYQKERPKESTTISTGMRRMSATFTQAFKKAPTEEQRQAKALDKVVSFQVLTPQGRVKTVNLKIAALVEYLQLNPLASTTTTQQHIRLLKKYADAENKEKLQEYVDNLAWMVISDDDRLEKFKLLIERGPAKDTSAAIRVRAEELPAIDFSQIDRTSDSFKALQEKRGGLSTTISQTGEHDAALERFNTADEMMMRLATAGEPLTLDFVCELHRTIIDDPRKLPGKIREKGFEVSEGAGLEYIAGRQVEGEMDRLLNWLNGSIDQYRGNKGKMVEIAAKAYSWAVSIHPFCDGNGRVTRLIMDYTLARGALLPSSPANVKVAVHGGISEEENDQRGTGPSAVVEHVMDGVEVSYKIMANVRPKGGEII